ncbi:MAG: PH domain-containing protein [Pseudomonadota bacterium]
MFENAEIPLEDLPQAEAVEWQPLDSAYRSRLIVDRIITIAFLVAGLIGVQFVPGVDLVRTAVLGAGVAVAAAAMLAWPGIAVPRMGYVIRDKDLVYRSGVLWRSVTAVPFNRIQHVETSSSPLDRRFGLATLKLFTAGGAGGDLKIDGLAAGQAEQMRALVLEKAGASIESR